MLVFEELIPVIAAIEASQILAFGFTFGLVLILLLNFGLWKQTTLRFPLIWTLIATADLACLTWSASPANTALDSIQKSAIQFAVGAMTLCPLMSVLGAKRPQDMGWNWVVLTLWIVLVWPAAQAVLLPQGTRLELFLAWKLFVVGLIGLGLLNYLPTRNALAALVTAIGQYAIFDPYLLNLQWLSPEWIPAASCACFFVAVILSARQKNKEKSKPSSLDKCSQQWRQFRDAYGAFWALRLLGRLIQSAQIQGWTFQPTWSGFIENSERASTKQITELEQTMDSFLRRFI